MVQYELYDYQSKQLLFTPLKLIGNKKSYNHYTLLNDYICITNNYNDSKTYKIITVDNTNHILYLSK